MSGYVLYRLMKWSPLERAPLCKSMMEAPPLEPPLTRPFLASLSKALASLESISPSFTARPHFAGKHSANESHSQISETNYLLHNWRILLTQIAQGLYFLLERRSAKRCLRSFSIEKLVCFGQWRLILLLPMNREVYHDSYASSHDKLGPSLMVQPSSVCWSFWPFWHPKT